MSHWELCLDLSAESAYHLYSEADQALIQSCLERQEVIDFDELTPRLTIDAGGVTAELNALGRPFVWSLARGDVARRAQKGAETLCRVTGANRGSSVRILDATAGLGREACLMASAGAEVHAVERSLPLYLMIRGALHEAQRAHEADQPLFTLTLDESQRAHESMTAPFDVIYLDPMFPVKTKRAQVGREAQVLKAFAAPPSESDDESLLTWALEAATRRVVVKRPLKAKPLPGPKPTAAVKGRTVRFDIYGKRRLP